MNKIKSLAKEVSAAIFPVTLVVILLQIFLIRLPLEDILQFLIGVLFVSIGFFLFLMGVHAGMLNKLAAVLGGFPL